MTLKPAHIACTPPFAATVLCCLLAVLVSPSPFFSVAFLALAIIFLFDTCARYREYVILVYRGGPWEGRDIKYFRSSFSRRWAAVQAGMDPQIFHHLGYRWWHILPDRFPQCFFLLGFWRNLLGIKKPEEKKNEL